jgi:RNA polymerase sigma-70 factor (ECF subfamily)
MNDVDDQLRELLPRMRRFAVSLTRDPSSADDLVQSSLEKALSAWSSKRPDGDLRAWLFSILYRQFLDSHRRSRRYSRMLELFTGGKEDHFEPSVERTVVAQTTLQAFERLNTEQRALLLYRWALSCPACHARARPCACSAKAKSPPLPCGY